MKQSLTIAVLALAVGSALGYYIATETHSVGEQAATSTSSNEPLYWVAPMDPNYKRDKPGKSPMGMDLIPVYEEDLAGGNKEQAGTVSISPAVENSLGVKTTQVNVQNLEPKIDTVGYVSFDESQLWQINSRISGWIQKLNVDAIGEKVNKGDVLFEVYSPDLVRAQEELLNAKRIGKAVLVKGAKERLASLGVDNSQINEVLRRGKAKRNIAIKAPANGVIATLSVRNGAYLSPQQTVISGGSLDNVWVDAEIFERQAHWIKSGTYADMRIDALPGKQWQGEVDYVYPILDPQTRTLRVRLKFPNPDGELKPNMFASLTMVPRSNDTVIAVPDQAVIRTGNMTRVVLALGEGKYRSTRIETGRVAGGMVEVLKGLTAQDSVVTSAHFMLDSESSQSADLSRIAGTKPIETNQKTVNATGVIRNVMANHKMLTIEHAPIEQWSWPAMTMDFTVGDSSNLSQLKNGQSVDFILEKSSDGKFVVSRVIPARSNNSVDHNTMDHSQMDHGVMNGGNTDHSTMDHSTMDHSQMNHGEMEQATKAGAQ
ncbi:efflux RND transporter periplasmic adaptor subunit [Photobacterium sp. OFAV2-7]|uniref:efflux RND transporter periplasmic adaptor subunit n=1 Tax=Photobacterium sp. OFAV2-7 TaxID=2917748 RepID=UPI001EF6A0E3|nr:efflux RND transporter periplasmic adaptor subunit [Photobacterium sp. OFAV2-7]MCG7586677.1 efflux RND transporter periplasmic adaptor subunit [Photobacterium sp. OFAV2-7]